MRQARNPFSQRRSESIETEAAFLNLFEPGVLDILDEDDWCDKVRPIRSAAGGGKTSLLRLLTPSVLLNLHGRRNEPAVKDLYQKLCRLGALGEDGPCLLGVMIMCGRNYALLHELDIDEARRQRLFFSLLNVRIILATLRAAMSIRQLAYPDDLARLRVSPPQADGLPPGLRFPCTGKDLYEWGAGLEARICEMLDSFGPLEVESLPGHDSLFGLSVIRHDALEVDGKPVASRTLLMMDDIHKLMGTQRERLFQEVIELRSPVGVWIAERFEALTTSELLASGASEGRDYGSPIVIESYWRRHYQNFEKYSMRIADRRVRASTLIELEDFRPCIPSSLEAPAWVERFGEAAAAIKARLEPVAGRSEKYREWFASTERKGGTPREAALAWRTLEILVARAENRRQMELFDDSIPASELDAQSDSGVANAAELFVCKEFGIPYYFGPERVARLASLNIQQFLGLSAEVFEGLLSADLLDAQLVLPPEEQHRLLKAAAKSLWDGIPRSVKHGRDVRNLIDGIGRYAHWYTYQPTAPNDPGVGGSAIRMSERGALLEESRRPTRPDMARLAAALASAIAHNLIVVDLDYRCKGELWMVLNLNRLLCVHYDLPLGYGLYKERPAGTLCEWLDRPFDPPRPKELPL
jgi:hypothetical protein